MWGAQMDLPAVTHVTPDSGCHTAPSTCPERGGSHTAQTSAPEQPVPGGEGGAAPQPPLLLTRVIPSSSCTQLAAHGRQHPPRSPRDQALGGKGLGPTSVPGPGLGLVRSGPELPAGGRRLRTQPGRWGHRLPVLRLQGPPQTRSSWSQQRGAALQSRPQAGRVCSE